MINHFLNTTIHTSESQRENNQSFLAKCSLIPGIKWEESHSSTLLPILGKTCLLISLTGIVYAIACIGLKYLRFQKYKDSLDSLEEIKKNFISNIKVYSIEELTEKKNEVMPKILEIKNYNIKRDICKFMELIESETKKVIEEYQGSEPGVLKDARDQALTDMEDIAQEVQEFIKGQDMRPAKESNDLKAEEWKNAIIAATWKSDLEGFNRLATEGEKQGFLNLKFYFHCNYCTLLHHLAKMHRFYPLLAQLPLDKLDLSVQEDIEFGNTCLHWAIANAINESAMLILEKGKDKEYLDVQCNFGNTALHLAIAKGYVDRSYDGDPVAYPNSDIVKKIISLGANVNLANERGNTPLHLAAVRRDSEMIALLLKNGANPKLKNKDGKKARDLLDITLEKAKKILTKTVDKAFLLDEFSYTKNFTKANNAFEVIKD